MSEDIKALNLNSKLISNNSLFAQPSDFTPSINFDANTDRNSITTQKIKNFSFSSGTGGTIVLGGSNNGNGLLLVKTSSGGTAVVADNTGITIYNGNLTVINSAGSTIIDSAGLVSTANFAFGQLFNGSATATTSSSTYTDISGGLLGTLVLTRSAQVLTSAMVYGYNTSTIDNNGSCLTEAALYDTFYGTNFFNLAATGECITNVTVPGGTLTFKLVVDDEMVSRSHILQFDAGTHVLKLQYKATGGGTAVVHAYSLNYLVLGN